MTSILLPSIMHRDKFLQWWIVGSIFLVLWAAWAGVLLYFFAAVAGIILWIILLQRVEWWLCVTLFLYGITLMEWSPEVTPLEVFTSFFFVISYSVWFLNDVLVRRRRIFRTYDIPFLLLLSLAVLSIVQAICFSSSILLWVRELANFSLMLLYLPLREVLDDTSKRRLIMTTFIGIVIVLSIAGILHYRERIVESIAAGRSLFAVRLYFGLPFPFMMYYGMMIAAIATRLRTKVAGVILSSFCMGMLIISLGRTYWLVSIIGSILLFLLLGRKYFWRGISIGVILLAVGATAIVVVYTYIPLSQFFFEGAVQRMFSTGAGVMDPAVRARIIESESGVHAFLQNPFIGYGLGSLFTIFEAVDGYHKDAMYFHNGYLWILVKLGVIGFVALLSHYGVRLHHAWVLLRSGKLSGLERGYVAVAVAGIVTMLLAAPTEMCFMVKQIIVFAVLGVAIIDWRWEKFRANERLLVEKR